MTVRRDFMIVRNPFVGVTVKLEQSANETKFVYTGIAPKLWARLLFTGLLSYFLWNAPPDRTTLQLAANGASSPTTIKLPFTLGKWADSEPVTVSLKQGQNTLHFWRDQAPQSGVALKEFTLKPVSGL